MDVVESVVTLRHDSIRNVLWIELEWARLKMVHVLMLFVKKNVIGKMSLYSLNDWTNRE